MRDKIVAEIKRLAAANNGVPPGAKVFHRDTQFREYDWRGVFWARWGDALQEAGFSPNSLTAKLDTDMILSKIAEVFRHYQRMPTVAELKMFRLQDSSLPDYSTLISHFGSKAEIPGRLKEWAALHPEFSDIVPLIPETRISASETTRPTRDGHIYLIKSGAFYKIGRGDELEKRVKQIRTALPDASELVHSIRTDDPPGIEAYWHRRFADKRANGEWFKLSTADVAAFRRRKYQ